MNTFNHHYQIRTYSIENLVVPKADADCKEGELEQKAEFLITRCYQLLAEIQEKRDRRKLPF